MQIKSLASITTFCLFLTTCCSAMAATGNNGAGYIDCEVNFHFESTYWGDDEFQLIYQLELSKSGKIYKLSGTETFIDNETNETFDIDAFNLKVVKKGDNFITSFSTTTTDMNGAAVALQSKYTYPKTGGATQFHARVGNTAWVDMLDTEISDTDANLKLSGTCDYTPTN